MSGGRCRQVFTLRALPIVAGDGAARPDHR
ncbi:hypothetical protein H4W34_005046 [Actinomadura algeriensis]|uniref:Uncharacterized protein n=1 Tax=Actinomadura algeriensis TaxID=1679523 RepID=A0ABR9JXK4_9ACTN|nr:hypothetical protein [Actinomadura algeriensis]